MALRTLRVAYAGGAKTLAEWDSVEVTDLRLTEIKAIFDEKLANQHLAANTTDKADILIREFDKNANILILPKVGGGMDREIVLELTTDMSAESTLEDREATAWDRAKADSKKLLQSIVSENEWAELEKSDTITVVREKYTYEIAVRTQTTVRRKNSGRIYAYACIRTMEFMPVYNRMASEYLLLKNDEKEYWKTANIFLRTANEFNIPVLFLIAFDIALFVDLIIEVLTVH